MLETAQVPYNLLNPSAGEALPPGYPAQDYDGLLDVAAETGTGAIGIRVLAGGALRGTTDRHPVASESLEPIGSGADYAADVRRAARLGALVREGHAESLVEAGLRFATGHPALGTVLVGTSSVEQLELAVAAVERGPLEPAALERLAELRAGFAGRAALMARVARLEGMAGIGVDRMGAAADAAGDPEILRLENLDTDMRPLPAALEATRGAIDDDAANSYLPFPGHARLRRAAAAHVSRLSGVEYAWEKQCLISAGGLNGILNVLLALVETGDEVVLTDPIYIGLTNRVRLTGATPRFARLEPGEDGWRLDRDSLRAAITPRTRALLLMSPSMPSGAVLDRGDWELAAELCEEHDLWLVYNAAMERLLFDGRELIHPAALLPERTITVGTASKELRMIGWRVGWTLAPESVVDDIGLVGISNVVCQVGIAQDAVAVALEAGDEDVAASTRELQARRDVLLSELAGLPVIPPHGGWSLLLDTLAMGVEPAAASGRLFAAKVAATPMLGWGAEDRYVRFVFANEPADRLRGIGARVREALT